MREFPFPLAQDRPAGKRDLYGNSCSRRYGIIHIITSYRVSEVLYGNNDNINNNNNNNVRLRSITDVPSG